MSAPYAVGDTVEATVPPEPLLGTIIRTASGKVRQSTLDHGSPRRGGPKVGDVRWPATGVSHNNAPSWLTVLRDDGPVEILWLPDPVDPAS